MKPRQEALESVRHAVAYLKSCGIRVPPFRASVENSRRLGGSYVLSHGDSINLNIGRYPLAFLRNWFAMHEIGHVLWAHHRPLRWKRFRLEFGAPPPDDYYEVYQTLSWITPASHRLGWFAGPQRPSGEPSWYGANAGGEERFCELIALMYAHGDFSKNPPSDLAGLWDCCWTHALAKMT